MSQWDNHQPGTYTEYLLLRIANALEGKGETAVSHQPETAVLREPENMLPDDLPHRDKLFGAGFGAYAQLPKTATGLKKHLTAKQTNEVLTYIKQNK